MMGERPPLTMNNELQHIDPETGSAIFSRIAPDSPLLHAPAKESTHPDVDTLNDDPRRSSSVHWPRHLAVLPLQQGKPSAAPEAIEVLGDLEEAAPHALALLSRVWGKPEAARAFRTLFLGADGRARRWAPAVWAELVLLRNVHHDLIFDSRGDRAGWPVEVWNDLVLLQEIHEQVYGKLRAGADPWKSFFLNT